MDKENRRAAKTAWREREERWEIVAIRIGAQVWVRLTPNAAALENRIGFMLRTGGGRGLAAGMAAGYAEAGEMRCEVVERLDEDLSPLARERVGAARLAHWAEALGARTF